MKFKYSRKFSKVKVIQVSCRKYYTNFTFSGSNLYAAHAWKSMHLSMKMKLQKNYPEGRVVIRVAYIY